MARDTLQDSYLIAAVWKVMDEDMRRTLEVSTVPESEQQDFLAIWSGMKSDLLSREPAR